MSSAPDKNKKKGKIRKKNLTRFQLRLLKSVYSLCVFSVVQLLLALVGELKI